MRNVNSRVVSLTIIDCRTKVQGVLRLNRRRTSSTADPEDGRTQAFSCNRLSTSQRRSHQSTRYLRRVEYEEAAGIIRLSTVALMSRSSF